MKVYVLINIPVNYNKRSVLYLVRYLFTYSSFYEHENEFIFLQRSLNTVEYCMIKLL